MKTERLFILLVLLSLACTPTGLHSTVTPSQTAAVAATPTAAVTATPLPATPTATVETSSADNQFSYTIQPGDTLPALAARFKMTADEIVAQNSSLAPADQLTALPSGQKLSLQLKNKPDWQPPTPILPDALFVNGPPQVNSTSLGRLIKSSNGWLKTYVDSSSGAIPISASSVVNNIVINYSLSPRLMLAILEYRLQALSETSLPQSFWLGTSNKRLTTLYSQLSWAANTLNNGYYGWRSGSLTQFSDPDGKLIIPNPGDNAASVALQYYFSRFLSGDVYLASVSAQGLAQSYQDNFGPIDWTVMDNGTSFIPTALKQPDLTLPFQPKVKWDFTGGPHAGWGSGEPLSAIDFSPASATSGCDPSPDWVTAVADGTVVRSENGLVLLDLDNDGNAQTGWAIMYLHIYTQSAPTIGTQLKAGDTIGHPSCDGGNATGRHVHIARLYNGEWIPATGPLAFNLAGWIAIAGDKEYEGTLLRGNTTVKSSTVGEHFSTIIAEP
jgi:LasA protease